MRQARIVVLAAAAALSGCSFASDTLWPSLTGDEPAPPAQATGERIEIQPSQAELQAQQQQIAQAQPVMPQPAPPPQLGTGSFAPSPFQLGQPTGTFVGQKAAQLNGELQRLQEQLRQQNQNLQLIRAQTTQNAQRYHGTVAAITARLQLGTTPGNPVLVSQWNAAQAELDRISGDIADMNTLANNVAANSSLATYILESARAAYSLAGAIDEDHRQLAILEDQTNRTVVLVDRLLNELNEDVSRQTAYVGNERTNLTTLSMSIKNGELFGTSLIGRAFAASGEGPAYNTPITPRTGFASEGRRPLVVIRFDRPDVAYEQALYTAVSRTLERRPEAQFDLVAVTPTGGSASQSAVAQSQSKKFANRVLRSLTDMGLPASRISLAATSSPGAATNEVHIYVR